MRKRGELDEDYPQALPVIDVASEKDAERLVILFGTLVYEGELAGRYVYTGEIDDAGTRWHQADQMARLDGMRYLKQRALEFVTPA